MNEFPPTTACTVPTLAALATAMFNPQGLEWDLQRRQFCPVRFDEAHSGIQPLRGLKVELRIRDGQRRPGDPREEFGGRQLLGESW